MTFDLYCTLLALGLSSDYSYKGLYAKSDIEQSWVHFVSVSWDVLSRAAEDDWASV